MSKYVSLYDCRLFVIQITEKLQWDFILRYVNHKQSEGLAMYVLYSYKSSCEPYTKIASVLESSTGPPINNNNNNDV